jgi:YHS domain-containing protein
MGTLVKDPVCGMRVEPQMYATEYLQSPYGSY